MAEHFQSSNADFVDLSEVPVKTDSSHQGAKEMIVRVLKIFEYIETLIEERKQLGTDPNKFHYIRDAGNPINQIYQDREESKNKLWYHEISKTSWKKLTNLHEFNDKYEGETKYGIPNGIGSYTFGDGSVYTGEFLVGKICGFGALESPSGLLYAGAWSKNKKCGGGKQICENGDIYEGYFKDNKFDGNGIYYFKSGKRQSGYFTYGYLSKGVYEYPDGKVYDGDLWNNKRSSTSTGTTYYIDGSRYIGRFRDDFPYKTGKFVDSNGEVFEGNCDEIFFAFLEDKEKDWQTFFRNKPKKGNNKFLINCRNKNLINNQIEANNEREGLIINKLKNEQVETMNESRGCIKKCLGFFFKCLQAGSLKED